MEKTLELIFIANDGKTIRLTVNDPREDLDEETIKNVMDQIVTADIFQNANGASIAAVKEARIVQRDIEVFSFDEE